ncbi:adenylyl-sulfate kinase [Streptomyces sp. SP17BM10]|uniref:adenylyl-sulfate kinase n=1 Tax=Streptomyces sp. SP17BM10 TaxID=3002530 RepID=UPI002E774DCC|nr:adenylyl-sulfate kinase [Streptomyces sp. SP17BM10]MEE1781686.1 adenylyl-sulfate kinase [Streptomyces sp. SP17BM10]
MNQPQSSTVFWLLGLPASGKTTLGRHLLDHLRTEHGADCGLYDADEQRATGVLQDLGWSPSDRIATIHALAHAASRHQVGIVTLVTSTEAERQLAADLLGERLHLIHVHAPEPLRHARDALRTNRAYRTNPAPDAPELSWSAPDQPALSLDTTAPLSTTMGALCAFAATALGNDAGP